jgi:hypothetical protein
MPCSSVQVQCSSKNVKELVPHYIVLQPSLLSSLCLPLECSGLWFLILPTAWLFLKIKTDKKQKNSSILHTLGPSKNSQAQLELLLVSNFCASPPLKIRKGGNCGSSRDGNHSTCHSRFFIRCKRFLFLYICCHNYIF